MWLPPVVQREKVIILAEPLLSEVSNAGSSFAEESPSPPAVMADRLVGASSEAPPASELSGTAGTVAIAPRGRTDSEQTIWVNIWGPNLALRSSSLSEGKFCNRLLCQLVARRGKAFLDILQLKLDVFLLAALTGLGPDSFAC